YGGRQYQQEYPSRDRGPSDEGGFFGARDRGSSAWGSDPGTRDERGEWPPSDWPVESRDTFGAGGPGGGSYGGESDPLRSQTGERGHAAGAGRQGWESQARMRNRGPKNWQRSDDRIRDDVCERLSRGYDID